MIRLPGILSVFLCVPLLYCSNQVAGGGTETTNGISGTVANKGDIVGIPVTAALYSIDYRPDSQTGYIESTSVSPEGNFAFTPPDEQQYNLLIRDTTGQWGLFLPGLPSDTALRNVSLKPTGSMKTFMAFGAMEARPYRIIIPGTPFYFLEEFGETVTISYIPEGAYECYIQVSVDSSTDSPVTIHQIQFTIDPAVDDTTIVPVQ